ncbi:hypothetical protein C8R43DRAFT_1145672 [Mycena crocata]|nr:hypothetical protein C8R43DRAFT_1145669 [Mycena crocata]KAJ7183043.1 hypothetical protein C8R43DRAFT_1145672 [Mycena crocata]
MAMLLVSCHHLWPTQQWAQKPGGNSATSTYTTGTITWCILGVLPTPSPLPANPPFYAASAMSSSCPHHKLASPTSVWRDTCVRSPRAMSCRTACKTELGIAQQRRARVKASAPDAARDSPTPAPSPIPPYGPPVPFGAQHTQAPRNWKQCQSAPGS